jgi:hypothetical protein
MKRQLDAKDVRIQSARTPAASMLDPGRMTANSSPPILPNASVGRSIAPAASQNFLMTSSPTVPYSNEAMRQDLQRVRNAWDEAKSSRGRNAIYGFLSAVYGLVAWWTAEGREIKRARRALSLRRLNVSDREGPFAAIIRCTTDSVKADKRTRSKWSRVMRYAAACKSDSEALYQFIRRKGGINACAAQSSRCVSPNGAARPKERMRVRTGLRENATGL